MTGDKFDSGKLRMDLIPASAEKAIARALTYGANKYADHNWRKGISWNKIIASLKRHLNEWVEGNDIDDESGLNHLDHIAANIVFLIEYNENYKEGDNRYKKLEESKPIYTDKTVYKNEYD